MSKENLIRKLSSKKDWIKKKYDYYEQENLRPDPSPVIPDRDKFVYNAKLDWCTEAVDKLANRLSFEGFENDNYMMWDIYRMNNKDVLFDSAIRSALISACCFIYISADEDGEPRLQVIDGANATGEIDPQTLLLKEGYAILDSDENGKPILEAYFTKDETVFFEKNKAPYSIPNPTGYPLLVPVIYRPDAKRPFGQSRISKAMMDVMDKARFCITRAEVTSEFGTVPQKYMLGLSPDAEFDSLANTYKTFLAIDKDVDGDKPTVGQFQQASSSGHLHQFETYKSEFKEAAGLDTPENLEQLAVKAQEIFGIGFLNAGLVARCLADETHYKRSLIFETEPLWKPVYRMDNAAINAFGDGVIKINQAIPDALDAKAVHRMTGLPVKEV